MPPIGVLAACAFAAIAGGVAAMTLVGAVPAAPVAVCQAYTTGVRTTGGFGRVVAADLDKRHLTLEHREIDDLKMPAMQMMFAVQSRAQMEQLKPGDRIHFTIDRSDM